MCESVCVMCAVLATALDGVRVCGCYLSAQVCPVRCGCSPGSSGFDNFVTAAYWCTGTDTRCSSAEQCVWLTTRLLFGVCTVGVCC